MPAALASFHGTAVQVRKFKLKDSEPGTVCDFKLTANFKLAADFVVTVPDFKFSWARVPQEPESSHVRANAGAD